MQAKQHIPATPPFVQVIYRVPDHQAPLLPSRRRSPPWIGSDTPIPSVGAKVYLSSTSAWEVIEHVHEWLHPRHLVVHVWLSYLGGAHAARETGFALTQ